MRCDKCNRKIEKGYLVNGELLCWLDAGEETRKTKKMVSNGFEKGSKEAKERMATVRAANKSNGKGIRAFIYEQLDQDPNMAPEKILTMILDKFPGARTGRRHVVWYKHLYGMEQA